MLLCSLITTTARPTAGKRVMKESMNECDHDDFDEKSDIGGGEFSSRAVPFGYLDTESVVLSARGFFL